MNRSITIMISILLCMGLALAYAQQQPNAVPKAAAPSPPEYRVMSLADMFEGDDEAKSKIAQLSVTVTGGDSRVAVTRTDMDVSDYERALNRWAKEGWTLVTVNKSNYWVFKKTRVEASQN